MNMRAKLLSITALLLGMGVAAWGQRPNITNAKLQEVSGGPSLKATLASIMETQSGPLWVGYRIPAQAKERSMCCWDSVNQVRNGDKCCLGCRMDSERDSNFTGTSSNCAPPEPLPYAFLFLKYENHQVSRVRVFSNDCPLDFAGLPLFWLNDVKPEQSVELLVPIAQSGSSEGEWSHRDVASQAVMAIAFHDVTAADQALQTLIQPNQPLRLREKVAFWLGVERGKPGLDTLRKAVKDDQDERFREKATFAISQSKEPEAVKDLIDMAHHDPSSRVRGQAIFWLAQIGGRKEAAQITDAIENDPDTDVKKKAVFALSQIRNGEGVPLLISVARTNKNPAVRKQAIFWLGQSNDPRALNYLEEILTK
jgi:hypothetical protein